VRVVVKQRLTPSRKQPRRTGRKAAGHKVPRIQNHARSVDDSEPLDTRTVCDAVK